MSRDTLVFIPDAMTILYFTTTGNSLSVARRLDPDRLLSIRRELDGCQSGDRYTDPCAIGLVCPVYFGRVPAPVAEFLEKTVLEAPYVFAILTCGNTPGTAAGHMRRLGMTKWNYIASICMVDNYFPMFDVAKQVRTLPSKRVDEHMGRIADDICHRRRHVRCATLYDLIAAAWLRMFPLSPSAYRNFYVDASLCNGCRICSEVCPIDNITYTPAGTPEMHERCLTCGACYHNCPSSAIRYHGEKSRYSYRHPEITLRDIIEANESEPL